MDYLDTFSAFAAGLDVRHVPAPVREQLGWILADTLGAIVGGSAEPELRVLAGKHRGAGCATCRVWGVPVTRIRRRSSTGRLAPFWKWTRATASRAATRRCM